MSPTPPRERDLIKLRLMFPEATDEQIIDRSLQVSVSVHQVMLSGATILAYHQGTGQYAQIKTDQPTEPSITCPKCGSTSFNPTDIEQGYCGACAEWTQETC